MTNNISKTISQFIESQFPAVYREEGEVLVSFIKAYYEYLEENDYLINRDMFTIRDIDTTYEQFLVEFQKKYLEDFPFVATTDTRFLVKNIIDLYRTKGSDQSIKLLLKLLFNEEAEVYYPSRDVLRASDSLWVTPKYVEVLSSERSLSFVNKQVFGSVSGAKAFVDAIVTKRSNNRLIDILYLSDVQGTFIFGDIISDDGVLIDAPRVIGSLTEVSISSSADDPGNNSIGDQLDVISDFGKNGKVAVSEITNATKEVNFEIIDGGFGYTLTNDTKLLISDVMVVRDNSNTVFETGESVFQRVEKIQIAPSAGFDLYNSAVVGQNLIGNISANSGTISAFILEKDFEIIDNIVNPFITIQVDQDVTFAPTESVVLTNEAFYQVGDNIEEGSSYQITVSSGPSFVVGEKLYQREFLEGTSNTLSSVYNFGTVSDFSNNIVTLVDAFGEFSANLDLIGETSEEVGSITDISVIDLGATGEIIEKISNTEFIVSTSGNFTANNKIRDTKNKIIETVESSENISVTTVQYGSNIVSDFEASNTFFVGTILEQNNETIKIATTSNRFIFVEGSSVLFDAQGNQITIDQIDPGTGASFKIGSLSNIETINIEDEKIGDTNIAGVPYDTILLNGQGSGVGYVEDILVISGGSGYTNTSVVTISGGGYLDQDPLINAKAQVTTDGTGVITSITVTEIGEGYYQPPEISVADGAGANLSLSMVFGYGFPAEPFADSNTIISDALSTQSYQIGTIATLTENKPGKDYGLAPSISIENPVISAYGKFDQKITIGSTTGTFVIGDIIETSNTSAKGIVTSANNTTLFVKDISFEGDFIIGDSITGSVSTASATVSAIEYRDTSVMGENANISNTLSSKNGIISKVKVIDSGFGYQRDELVTLEKPNVVLAGVATVSQQGISPGYWKSTTSHLNSEKRLHDNRYYQDFSYDVKSSINIEDYKNIVLDILHVAGTEFFGSVIKTTESDPSISSETTIQQI